MEPVTHLLTGACLARTGFHRRVAYATAAMTLAAEFPDIDTVWSLRGPVSGFEHHRGLTHSFVGVPVEAAFLLLVFFAWHRFRGRRTGTASPRPPVRWAALYGLLLVALLSHLLLDFTNNYGLRPFLPFNAHWYAASLVFIFDPWIFLLLVAALVLPALFRLVSQEIGARQTSPSPGWAATALLGVLALWSVRAVEHGRAVALAQNLTLRAPGATLTAPGDADPQGDPAQSAEAPEDRRPLLTAQRSLANPDPLSLFRWYTVTDFGPAYRLAVADTSRQTTDPGRILVKPETTEPGSALGAAEASRLGGIYLQWSPMPWITVGRPEAAGAGAAQTEVMLLDPRFMATTPLLQRGGPPPLSGEILLDGQNHVVAEGMDGRLGR